MKLHVWPVFVLGFCAAALAQPALVETVDYPRVGPGPEAVYSGSGCFLLAQGSIVPGDVDWIRMRIPRVSTRTVIDVDFPTGGSSGSALLAMVRNGTTGFNTADNNNTRDALCGLHGTSSPVGSTRDSVSDLRNTPLKAVIDIAITGAADTGFVGLHTESFTYQVWAYAQTVPCLDDAGCDDAVDCTVDQCNMASGDCMNVATDSLCDDGAFCNGVETCDAELGCMSFAPPSCDDQVDCTDDYCDVLMDACVHDAYDDLCDDGLFCNGDEFCDANFGCRAGPPPDCEDEVDCTVDSCDENTWGCVHTLSTGACDDGLFCNGLETCDFDSGCVMGSDPCPGQMCRESDQRCVACLAETDCDDGIYCNGMEQCDASGSCMAGNAPCMDSMCRESDDRCVQCLADADCDDGAFCNGQESCSPEGVCQAGPMPCSSGKCRENDDQCVQCLQDADCDDGVFCNGQESCSPQGVCQTGVLPCGTSRCRETDDQCVQCLQDADCDNGNFCDGAEFCDAAGQCNPGAGPCGNLRCRESDDRCVECLSNADCTDGQFCNGEEFCTTQGTCEAGAPACGAGLCRESDDHCVDCLADHDCDDGLFCNGAEHCQPNGKCGSGTVPCGQGQTCDESTDQCVTASFTMNVMPSVCPANLAAPSRGYLSVAISGPSVSQINVNSLQLSRSDGVGSPVDTVNGPPEQAPQLRDVTGAQSACMCPDAPPDGSLDLLVSFKADKVLKSLRLDVVRQGVPVQLRVTGRLMNGASFSATDCLTIQGAATGMPGAN